MERAFRLTASVGARHKSKHDAAERTPEYAKVDRNHSATTSLPKQSDAVASTATASSFGRWGHVLEDHAVLAGAAGTGVIASPHEALKLMLKRVKFGEFLAHHIQTQLRDVPSLRAVAL